MFCDNAGRPAICIGPIPINFYGIIIVLGALIGGYIAASEARRRGHDPDIVWDGLVWVVLAGIVGARLYHVFSVPAGCAEGVPYCGWPWYRDHPLDIILGMREVGGLGIFGAVLVGGLALFVYARRRKLPVLRYLDFAAPALLIGQAIGRWGNFVNQELYGPPTNLPWGISIDALHRTYEYVDLARYPVETTRFHPLFLYESMLNLLGFVVLIAISRRFASRLKAGDLILLYFIWYPVVRIFVESYRFDAWISIGNIPTATLISIVAALIALIALILRHRRRTAPLPA
ncbi:MAG TPA: prolipoprotein diacylglyceryl transferase [Anaerolineae bacterium]|nr:prolipoprotein diacylglyceryl transferase [Anaerolineae bacterium]